jgi:hypothetical protein
MEFSSFNLVRVTSNTPGAAVVRLHMFVSGGGDAIMIGEKSM